MNNVNAKKQSCGKCVYAKVASYDSYTCQRHAPIAVLDLNKNAGVYQEAFVPRWPVVSSKDWCGDFILNNTGDK